MLCRWKLINAANLFLLTASILFYAYWDPKYLYLIIGSIIINYIFGTALFRSSKSRKMSRKTILTLGIILNVLALGYYKYAGFFVSSVDAAFDLNWTIPHIVLPLGISFFTFTQIAYLVDCYKGETKEFDFVRYSFFVFFFPHLIAGPIVHHTQIIPPFGEIKNKSINDQNVAIGLMYFAVGLFKKVVIADQISPWVNIAYSHTESLRFIEAWLGSLAYTLQLYFDFSGYSDMAVGLALLFNIRMAQNFLSPYKSLDIQEFWRRWHVTLSSWLRDYIYIPLGGNRKGPSRTLVNLFLTFFLGGIWHGAGWTFVVWGAMHGAGVMLHRLYSQLGFKLNKVLAWTCTFIFVHFAWVFFRAPNLESALSVCRSLMGLNGITLPDRLRAHVPENSFFHFGAWLEGVGGDSKILWVLPLCLLLCLLGKNSTELEQKFRANPRWIFIVVILFVISFLHLNRESEFLYFQF